MSDIQNTSLMAYRRVEKSLSFRQQQVYDALLEIQPANNLMIAQRLNLPINSITPRIKELRDAGLVLFGLLKKCPYTNRISIFWKIPRSNKERADQIKLILENE